MQVIIKFLVILFIIFFNFNAYSKPLVNADWLEDKICKDGYVVLEVHRSKNNYAISHIPCSVFTNFYESGWRETRNDISMLMPTTDNLVKVIEKHGISNSDHVIISAPGTGKYDAAEMAAIFFTFKYLGHEKVSILEGGFKGWESKWDRDIEAGFQEIIKGKFIPNLNNKIIANMDDVKKLINKKGLLVDARSTDMYLGINMIFPALKNGTIPNSTNIPNTWLLKNNTLYFHKLEKLEEIINYAGITKQSDIISFCNAGLESALSWFVMSELLKYPNNKLYEASLAEWSKYSDLPMTYRINIDYDKLKMNEDDGFSIKSSN